MLGKPNSPLEGATRVIPRRTWDIDRVATGIETDRFNQLNGLSLRLGISSVDTKMRMPATWVFAG